MKFVGQTKGSLDVEIQACARGFLQGINYKEGPPIKKGDLLFTIDLRPFESVVAQRRSET